MTQYPEQSEARERVLVAAERLFAQRGYASITLRDIAAEIGIRHTSLYHHVPGGKEALFVEVTERALTRHQTGLTAAIEGSASDIRTRLCAAATWLLEQPPMDLLRMMHADIPAIDPLHAQRLTELVYSTLIGPLEAALEQAHQRGEIGYPHSSTIAGGLFGMIESLHAIPTEALERTRQEIAFELIDVLLHGLYPR